MVAPLVLLDLCAAHRAHRNIILVFLGPALQLLAHGLLTG